MGSRFLSYCLCYLVFIISVNGQNLIPNPGFEIENSCQIYHESCSPAAWRATNTKLFFYPPFTKPKFPYASAAYEGNHFVTLLMYDQHRPTDRKFLQTRLLCPLEKGKMYRLQMKVKRHEFEITNFGISFAPKLILEKNNDSLVGRPIDILFDDPLDKENEWLELTAVYEAKGYEQVMLIGNFSTTSVIKNQSKKDRKKQKKRYRAQARAYYSFDQVELIPEGFEVDCPLLHQPEIIFADNIRHRLEVVQAVVDIPPKTVDTIEQLEFIEPAVSFDTSLEKINGKTAVVLEGVSFESGSATLRSKSFEILDQVRTILIRKPGLRVNIIGHTDNIGNPKYNLLLSEARAQAVYHYLIRQGIDSDRLHYEGMGARQPIDSNDTATGRKNNRRVELKEF